mmetsp:Transcript_44677/g.103231  ORF Transcript_44677/g.103231 Transcript_44677/m.103231 type:complete len:218 (+) Transcript_44677:142-795(+)
MAAASVTTQGSPHPGNGKAAAAAMHAMASQQSFAMVSSPSHRSRGSFVTRAPQVDPMRDLLERYDVNRSGKLEEDEVRHLLADFNEVKPGKQPSNLEYSYVLKTAGAVGENAIGKQQLMFVLKYWRYYTRMTNLMETCLREFDRSRTGSLTKEELMEYLTALNDGKPVTSKDVDWVNREAKKYGDEMESSTALMLVTTHYFTRDDDCVSKSVACNLL